MRLSLPARWLVVGGTLAALGACSDDGTDRAADAFDSPYGNPGGGVVCGALEYLVGATCVSRSPLDAGAPVRDASADGAAPADDAGPRAPGPATLDAGFALGAST